MLNSQISTMPQYFRPYNEVVNCFAAVPGLVCQTLSYIDNRTNGVLKLSPLADALCLRRNIKHWCSTFLSSFEIEGLPFVEIASNVSNNPFPTAYLYANSFVGGLMPSFYSYLIVINAQIELLDYGESIAMENKELVKKICMSIEYCSQAGLCGSQCLAFVLPIALSACQDDLSDWIREQLVGLKGF
jgi:hypothetical protein